MQTHKRHCCCAVLAEPSIFASRVNLISVIKGRTVRSMSGLHCRKQAGLFPQSVSTQQGSEVASEACCCMLSRSVFQRMSRRHMGVLLKAQKHMHSAPLARSLTHQLTSYATLLHLLPTPSPLCRKFGWPESDLHDMSVCNARHITLQPPKSHYTFPQNFRLQCSPHMWAQL